MDSKAKLSPHFKVLLGIVLGSLALKLLLMPSLGNLPLRGDPAMYWQNSVNALAVYFSRLDYQAPLYPIFIFLSRTLFGQHALLAVKIEQVLIHSLEVILVYALAARFFPRRAALAAGIIACFYPELVSFSYLLFSETFFLAFFLGFVILYFDGLHSRGPRSFGRMALAGVLYGLATLVRAGNLYFFPLTLLHLWIFGKRPGREKLALSLVLTLFLLLPVSVQTFKNYRLAGCFIPVDTSPYQTLYKHHNLSYPLNMDFRGCYESPPNPCPDPNICEQKKCQTAKALAFIKAHPLVELRHAVIKVINLYSPNLRIYRVIFNTDTAQYPNLKIFQGRWFRVLGSSAYLILVLLAMLGLALSKERELKTFSLFLIAFYTLACAIALGGTRYRMAFLPFLIIYAGAFLGLTRPELAAARRWKLLLCFLAWVFFLYVVFSRLVLILS